MKVEPGKRYLCSDPSIKAIEIIHIDELAKRPVLAILENFEGKRWKASYDLNGKWIGVFNRRLEAYDIIAEAHQPVYADVYINIYQGKDGKLYVGGIHPDRGSAHKANEDDNKVSCARIRLRPGVWDD